MPVPVSVTNPDAIGLSSHVAIVAPTTLGPFERMAALKAAAAVAQSPEGPVTASSSAPTHSHEPHVSNDQHECSVLVRGLEFAYPGIGECHAVHTRGPGGENPVLNSCQISQMDGLWPGCRL